MTKLLLSTVAVLALAGAAHAAPAVAADNDAPAVHVSTLGVNFNDAAQARRFYFKLQTAAHLVCQSGSADRLVAGTEDIACVRNNMRDAVRKVDAPQLTAMLGATYGSDARTRAFAADAR